MKKHSRKRKLELNRQSVRRLTQSDIKGVVGGDQTGNGACWVNTVRFDCFGRTGAANGCTAGSGWQDCGFVPGE